METQPNPNLESTQNTSDKDFLSRRVDDLLRLIGAMKADAKSTILTVSLVANFWLGYKFINQNEILNGKITEEVRKQVPAAVKQETDDRLGGVVDTIKITTQDVREFINANSKKK